MARKPIWTEGLFVTQHHFQQLDRYHEARTDERLRVVLAHNWGIRELEIDARALAAGQLRVVRLQCTLPGGLTVHVGEGADDQIPARAIEGAFAANARSLDVYVAIAQETDSAAIVDLDAKPGSLARYIRADINVADVNTGSGETQLGIARPNLRLVFGDERRDAFDALRIAQLVRSPAGAVVQRETFVPAVVSIRSSPFLMNGFGRLLTAMAARQRALAESRRQRTATAIDFQASDAAKFWLLNVLNASLPVISHLVDHGTAHPEEAYLALASFIGQLCTFAVDGDPLAVPKYNLLELGDVFEPMFARALVLLQAVIAEKYLEIPLQRREDGMYVGKVEDPRVMQYEFFLASRGTMPEAAMRDRMPRLMKIASWNHIGAILNSAVNGARIEPTYQPPGALPVKPGIVFFKVLRTPEYWPDIASTGTLALYNPPDPAGTAELTLYAVDPAHL
jgi:type VI secretion system protein ImpJ